MKKHIFKILPLLFIFIFSSNSFSQSIEELYMQRNYNEIIKFAEKPEELTAEQFYYIGYAYFQLEDDVKAIKMYDKAIEKGLETDYIHLYKGLALMYNKQYAKAKISYKKAITINPKGQKNYTELGNLFYFQNQYDSALVYFYKAREQEFELGDPYLKVPNIFHIQKKYDKALEEYKLSANLIDKETVEYLEIINSIAQLEYSVYKNYENSIKYYKEIIAVAPENYDIYSSLINVYNTIEDFENADSIFNLLKAKYEAELLPEEIQKYGSIDVYDFTWNDQRLVVYKYFKKPTEILDEMYRIYLIDKEGKTIERTFMTEKTFQLKDDSPKHILCERSKNGTHHTYSYGWNTDEINVKSLKELVLFTLNENISPSASSNFNTNKKTKKKKKDKK